MRKNTPILIAPENMPIMSCPEDHPARDYVTMHSRFMDKYAELEIPWKGREHEAFDFEWHCESDGRVWLISTFIYHFLGFYHIQWNWLENPPYIMEYEVDTLEKIGHAYQVLESWERAAKNNARALERSIRLRLRGIGMYEDEIRAALANHVD